MEKIAMGKAKTPLLITNHNLVLITAGYKASIQLAKTVNVGKEIHARYYKKDTSMHA